MSAVLWSGPGDDHGTAILWDWDCDWDSERELPDNGYAHIASDRWTNVRRDGDFIVTSLGDGWHHYTYRGRTYRYELWDEPTSDRWTNVRPERDPWLVMADKLFVYDPGDSPMMRLMVEGRSNYTRIERVPPTRRQRAWFFLLSLFGR